MIGKGQFDVAFILVVTLVVAVLLSFGQIWPVIFVVGQFVFIYLGSEYLLRHLPENVRQLQIANCSRADGSSSSHRKSVEDNEIRVLRSNIRLILTIGIAPWIMILWFNQLEMEPAILTCGIWLVVSFLVLRSGYLYYLKQFVFNLKRRSQQYKLRDLEMIIREEEITADRNRELIAGKIE